MTDFDAMWDAWLTAPGHETCGGFLADPGTHIIRCACGGTIPFGSEVTHGPV